MNEVSWEASLESLSGKPELADLCPTSALWGPASGCGWGHTGGAAARLS